MPDGASPTQSWINRFLGSLGISSNNSFKQEHPDWYREDGSLKGLGYLGLLKLANNGVVTEYSIADSEKLKDKSGKYLDYPSLVPTLSEKEVQNVLNAAASHRVLGLPSSVYDKAEQFALQRQQQGKPFFAQQGEQQNLYPNFQRAPVPSDYPNQQPNPIIDFISKYLQRK